jgi:penicillin-binding protein 1B
MKKASALSRYSDMRPFAQPTGVVDVQLDKATNRLATPKCPDDYVSAFVAGTEPRDTCDLQSGMSGFFSRMLGSDKPITPAGQPATAQDTQDPKNQDPNKKKGFFGKIAGVFKNDKPSTPPPAPPDNTQPAPH